MRVSHVIPPANVVHELARGFLVDLPRDFSLDGFAALIKRHTVSEVRRQARMNVPGEGNSADSDDATVATSQGSGRPDAPRPFRNGKRSNAPRESGAPIYLNVESNDALHVQIECNPSWKVEPSQAFIQELVSLLGRDRVHVIGPRKEVATPVSC